MSTEANNRSLRHDANPKDEVVQRLLDFAKPPLLEKQPMELSHVVDETLELLGRQLEQKKIAVERRYSALGSLKADEKQIKQVVLNILLNAIDAIPAPGSHLKGRVKDRKLPIGMSGKIVVAIDSYGPTRVVTISDNGRGMTEEEIEHVFDPMFAQSNRDSGLFLAMVKAIVVEHGGDIFVNSEFGSGTTFEIVLPTEKTN